MTNEKKTLTCKLTTPELQLRRATVIRELKVLLLRKEEIADGYRYSFPTDDSTLDKLLSFIKSERLCCDFFSFKISIAATDASLDITGPEGSKEFLDHEVGF